MPIFLSPPLSLSPSASHSRPLSLAKRLQQENQIGNGMHTHVRTHFLWPQDALVIELFRRTVLIRQHTSAYVSILQHTSYGSILQRTSAYVSIRQHTSAYVSIRQHTSAYVSIRQHMSTLSPTCDLAREQFRRTALICQHTTAFVLFI
jgi:hypothetical protein